MSAEWTDAQIQTIINMPDVVIRIALCIKTDLSAKCGYFHNHNFLHSNVVCSMPLNYSKFDQSIVGLDLS